MAKIKSTDAFLALIQAAKNGRELRQLLINMLLQDDSNRNSLINIAIRDIQLNREADDLIQEITPLKEKQIAAKFKMLLEKE